MQVRLLSGRVGDGFSQIPGEVIEVEEAEGARMIEHGQALAAERMPRETAAMTPVENASLPGPRGKRKQ